MKRRLLFLLMLIGISICVSAQKFEHFKVDMIGTYGWRLYSMADTSSVPGVNGMAGDHSGSIRKMIINASQALPKDIKEVLSKQDINLSFLFNKKGEVFRIVFRGRIREGIPLTDEQWRKVFDTISKLKIDLSKLMLLENFEWGSGGMYPISKYIREAEK